MSTGVTPDRRILKAFYTQYVAVLLIVLVFVVAGFQGNSRQTSPVFTPSQYRKDISIGAISIHIPEDAQQSFVTELAPELGAVAEFTRNHDVRATFRVPVIAPRDGDSAPALVQALHRASALRTYMVDRGVPSDAVTTLLHEAETASESTNVTFSSMEDADGSR